LAAAPLAMPCRNGILGGARYHPLFSPTLLHGFPRSRLCRGLLPLLLAAALLAALVSPGGGSALAVSGSPEARPEESGPAFENRVAPAGSFHLGKVRILGIPVLTVASPAVLGGGTGPDALRRAEVIEGNLQLLYRSGVICNRGESLGDLVVEEWVLRGRDLACDDTSISSLGAPDDLSIVVVPQRDGSTLLEARVPGRSRPLPLLTVTDDDARLNGTSVDDLARRWRDRLERRVRLARHMLTPASLGRRLGTIALVELGLALLLFLVLRLWSLCRQRLAVLDRRTSPRPVGSAGIGVAGRRALLAAARLLMVLVLVVLVVMTGVGLLAIPGQIPRALAVLLQPFDVGIKVITVLLAMAGLRALSGFLLVHWANDTEATPEHQARRQQRYRNLLRVFRRLVDLGGLFVLLIWVIVDIPGVRELSGGAVLASGALLGALALVYQGLLRDFVAGLVVLFDDRFAVGDWVEIGGVRGHVVDVGVLSTELRGLDRRVVVLQNSECGRVVNFTKLESGVEIPLLLSHHTPDLPGALAAIADELSQFACEPEQKPRLLEPPQLRGVSAVGPEGIRISVVAITPAGEQGSVERSLLSRLLARLRREGIPMAGSDPWAAAAAGARRGEVANEPL
jgi:small conductance mechanosensitive channel